MADEHLATYLNDHLAGASMALELLEHMQKAHAGTDLERFLAELHADIAADRGELEALMDRLNIDRSRPREAMAWMAEKMTRLKLHLDAPAGEALRLLESLDIVQAGIDGKRGLWRALSAAAEETPRLQGMDYERLIRRAEDQHRRAEPVRREAAREALADAPAS